MGTMNPTTLRADGTGIAALCKLAGIPVGDGQQRILDDVFATTPDGKVANPQYRFAAAGADVTSALQQCALGWLYLTRPPRILWTTADAPAARDAFDSLAAVINGSSILRAEVTRISRVNGAQEITMASGCRLIMRSRAQSVRGYAANRLIIDQAHDFSPVRHGSVLIAAAAAKNPQVVYGHALG
jgi:hypothetical protein